MGERLRVSPRWLSLLLLAVLQLLLWTEVGAVVLNLGGSRSPESIPSAIMRRPSKTPQISSASSSVLGLLGLAWVGCVTPQTRSGGGTQVVFAVRNLAGPGPDSDSFTIQVHSVRWHCLALPGWRQFTLPSAPFSCQYVHRSFIVSHTLSVGLGSDWGRTFLEVGQRQLLRRCCILPCRPWIYGAIWASS
eukprot:SAG31_NODE_10703_length_1108_cov_1.173439_1_plen_190_part_00